jgi:hypothetical protein
VTDRRRAERFSIGARRGFDKTAKRFTVSCSFTARSIAVAFHANLKLINPDEEETTSHPVSQGETNSRNPRPTLAQRR